MRRDRAGMQIPCRICVGMQKFQACRKVRYDRMTDEQVNSQDPLVLCLPHPAECYSLPAVGKTNIQKDHAGLHPKQCTGPHACAFSLALLFLFTTRSVGPGWPQTPYIAKDAVVASTFLSAGSQACAMSLCSRSSGDSKLAACKVGTLPTESHP